MKVGVLALQGAADRHADALARLGAQPVEVRSPAHLDVVDALVLPGGESTTVAMLLDSAGLTERLAQRLHSGTPVLGTCAGMILLAKEVLDGRADQRGLGLVDIAVRRNGYGRQVDSFEAAVEIADLAGPPFPAVFIRAPVVESAGPAVEVLAHLDGHPVACRQGRAVVTSFHPELAGDLRLHALFLELAQASRGHPGRGQED